MNARRSVALELAGIGALTAVFVASFQIRPAYVDFALAAAAVALIVLSAARSRRLWDLAAGYSASPQQDSRAAWRVATVFSAAALLALAALAAWLAARGNGPPFLERIGNWHLLVALALYFPWALLQQYIFQFYLFGRLLQLLPVPLATAVTAAAFASVHFPRWPVMAVTAVAGTVWALTYYRSRALLPLAASHAMLGTALHYWVFGHDLLESWLP